MADDRAMTRQVARAALSVLTPILTVGAMFVLVDHLYGFHRLSTALDQAHIRFLAPVLLLGIADQLLRARRAQFLLSAEKAVSLSASYGAMVVGHGVGDMLPLVPGGLALRSVLTHRLGRVPVAFAAGAYMLEGLFDGLGPALLAAYLLLALAAPAWTRWVLLGALLQSALLLLPILLRRLAPALHAGCARRPHLTSLLATTDRLTSGLRALTTRGWRSTVAIIAFSLAITAVAALQLALFLRAFSLHASARDMLLVLVLTMVSGSLPIKLPGFGTLTAVVVLPAAGVHGPGLAAYVLISRAVQTSQTPFLAACLLGWWAMTGNRAVAILGDLRRFYAHAAGVPASTS